MFLYMFHIHKRENISFQFNNKSVYTSFKFITFVFIFVLFRISDKAAITNIAFTNRTSTPLLLQYKID